jgi:hypothetical protein
MRKKKTAPRTRQHRQASPPQQSGLIAGETNTSQSAETRCALDNRSHRTSLVLVRGVPCESAGIPQRPVPTTLPATSCPPTFLGVRARPAETARIFAHQFGLLDASGVWMLPSEWGRWVSGMERYHQSRDAMVHDPTL